MGSSSAYTSALNRHILEAKAIMFNQETRLEELEDQVTKLKEQLQTKTNEAQEWQKKYRLLGVSELKSKTRERLDWLAKASSYWV